MIEILMATHNGERFLREQLESLFNQSFQKWRLTIQDDGSTDGTLAILQQYRAMYPNRIEIKSEKPFFGSSKANFFSLLAQSTGQYVMNCDQDDVWLKDKVERTYKAMKQLEQCHSPTTPLLVHTDLSVVGADLREINSSLFEMQGMDHRCDKLHNLMSRNVVTGCTVMVNRPLLKMLNNARPAEAIMHDWWLALLATSFGAISFVDRPTMLYRQHNQNDVGAKNSRFLKFKLKQLLNISSIKKHLYATYLQADCFLKMYRSELSEDQTQLLADYANMAKLGKIERCRTAWRLKTTRPGVLAKISCLIYF